MIAQLFIKFNVLEFFCLYNFTTNHGAYRSFLHEIIATSFVVSRQSSRKKFVQGFPTFLILKRSQRILEAPPSWDNEVEILFTVKRTSHLARFRQKIVFKRNKHSSLCVDLSG